MYEGVLVSLEVDRWDDTVIRVSNGDNAVFSIDEARELYKELGEALAEIDDGL